MTYEQAVRMIQVLQILVEEAKNGNLGGGGGGVYTGASPTNVTVGALTAGSDIAGLSLQDIIQSMTSTYLAPAFSSFSVSGQAQTVEVGTSISGTRSFTFSVSNVGNIEPNTLDIRDVTANTLLGSGLPFSSPQTLGINSILLNANGSIQQWRGEGINTQAGTFQSTNFTVTSRFLRFFAPVAVTPTNSAEVRVLPSTFQTANVNTFILTTGTTQQRFFVALPPGRTITSVIDLTNLNANITSAYTSLGTITVNDIGGTPRDYNAYQLTLGAPYPVSAQHQITTA
jgi:hypothetical protein